MNYLKASLFLKPKSYFGFRLSVVILLGISPSACKLRSPGHALQSIAGSPCGHQGFCVSDDGSIVNSPTELESVFLCQGKHSEGPKTLKDCGSTGEICITEVEGKSDRCGPASEAGAPSSVKDGDKCGHLGFCISPTGEEHNTKTSGSSIFLCQGKKDPDPEKVMDCSKTDQTCLTQADGVPDRCGRREDDSFPETFSWAVSPVADGVVHKYAELNRYGRKQVVNVIEADLSNPAVHVKPVKPGRGTCALLENFASENKLVAAVNGSIFAGCEAVSMEKFPDYPVQLNFTKRGIVGLDCSGKSPVFEIVEPEVDPASCIAMGSFPTILLDGTVRTNDQMHSEYKNPPEFTTDLHPRTAIGLSCDRRYFLLLTFDGRGQNGAGGINLFDLADFMKTQLGACHALNLDGGGSTKLWIEGRGIVNSPSEPARPIANGIGIEIKK